MENSDGGCAVARTAWRGVSPVNEHSERMLHDVY